MDDIFKYCLGCGSSMPTDNPDYCEECEEQILAEKGYFKEVEK